MALTKNSQIDLNGNEMILDADADTSITADTDDQIDIKVGGTDTVVITGGAIALKGTTPTLTIGDAGAEDTKIVFDGNAQDYYIGLDDSADDLIIGKGSTVGTTPAIVIDENLNIGIGTSSPASNQGFAKTVEISDAGATTGPDLMLTNPTAGTDEFLGQLSFNHANDALAAINAKTDGATDSGHIQFQTQAASGAITERMRITSDGKVGIGKTDPNYKLVVAGTNPKVQIYDSAGSGQTNLYFGDSGSNLAGFVIYQHSDNAMRFGTDATERMRIDGNGAVMFHTTTALGATTSLAGTNTNNFTGKTTTDTYSNFLGFASGGNITYYVTGQGNYFYNGSAVSDRDLKENIESITESSLAKVKLLEPKTFNFKADDNFGTNKKTGFIAQEVAAIFGTTDGVATGTDGQKDMGIDPTALIAHLTKAIQEQQTQIEALQSEINTLKGE